MDTNHTANLLEDIKYFHNAALSYQDAYEALQQQQAELQSKFTEQAQLVQEALDALKAVEAESSARQQEIATLRGQQEADIQHALLDKPWDSIKTSLAQHKLTYSRRIESTNNRSKSCRIKYMHWSYP